MIVEITQNGDPPQQSQRQGSVLPVRLETRALVRRARVSSIRFYVGCRVETTRSQGTMRRWGWPNSCSGWPFDLSCPAQLARNPEKEERQSPRRCNVYGTLIADALMSDVLS